MTKHQRWSFIIGAIALGLLLPMGRAFSEVAPSAGSAKAGTPEGVIAAWPNTPRHLARLLLQKYGEPKTFDSQSLVWENNRPYLKTIVFRQAPFSKGDILQQTIRYNASASAVDQLINFDKRIVVDRQARTMTMISDSERTNILALNLANEIASGTKTVKQANVSFKKEISLSKSGKSSPYMESFRFPIEP